MTIEVQIKLRENINYIKYLRENSNWYKILTRNPQMFDKFKEEVLTNYKLRPVDKMEQLFNSINIIKTLLDATK